MTSAIQYCGRDSEPYVRAAEAEKAALEDWAVDGRVGFFG